jgi:hypothetical protein
MGEAPSDSRCRISDVPRYVRDLVDEYWIVYGDGRSPLIDAPAWCIEMAGMIEIARAEKRAKERDQQEQEALARKAGLR